MTPLLTVEAVSKSFGDTHACSEVSLSVAEGERHALLGENGAGKSTLVKMIYGVLQPDRGRFLWRGQPTGISAPAKARGMGIGMVFQHFSVFDALNVEENIRLALPAERGLSARIKAVSTRYGLEIDPARPMHTLSVGEKQRVEIIRCLLQEPKLLIMDEPTSVLTPQEAQALFATLDNLSADGCAILYISHKLAEVTALCQQATILRHGKVVATCDPRVETPASMAAMMVGQTIATIPPRGENFAALAGQARVSVRDLSLPGGQDGTTGLEAISFNVKAGEIAGIAGIAGAGQGRLMAALMGEVPSPPGAITFDGEPVGALGPNARRRLGAAFVPEERNGHAAVPDMGLSRNLLLSRPGEGLAPKGWINRLGALQAAGLVRHAFDVRADGQDPVAGALSGGNLQKFVVGREILRQPGILVVNQPTWGVDAGAAQVIRQALIDLAADGSAVLVISQDLEELFAIADRIGVMHSGRLSALMPTRMMPPERIGLLMAGDPDPGPPVLDPPARAPGPAP